VKQTKITSFFRVRVEIN